MNSRISQLMLIVTFATMSGCATMSGDECVTSDWCAIGYEDGSRGYTADRLAKHRKACAKHGVTPDFTAYQTGRDQGLQEYCQPGRGFNIGANGGSYHGVCNVNLEADFLDGFNAGRHLYVLRSNVSSATSSINSKEREIERIEDRVAEKEALLIASETSQTDRILLLRDLKVLSERTGELESEIKELYDLRARSEVELQHYQLVVADLGY